MVKERRCNLFDDNGKPRRMKDGSLGCSRDASACHFAHPHERDWEAAQSSFPPRTELVADFDSDFYYSLVHLDRSRGHRGRDKERERDIEQGRERRRDGEKKNFQPESPSHRGDSMATRVSSSRSRAFESTMDHSGTSKRGRSPAHSASSDLLERLQRDSRGGRKDNETARRLPEPPSKPPPMQSPPPPQIPEAPQVPPFASNQQPTGSTDSRSKGFRELSLDEQRSAWHERIDLMFTSITLRRDHTKLESDLSQIRLLSNSSVVDNMPESERARLDTQRVALELQLEVKRKEVSETIQKLIRSEFWPVLRGPQISEMEKAFAEAKKHVLEVKGSMDDVKNSCAALLKTNAFDRTQDSDRPSKRRKLGDVGTPERSTGSIAQVMTEDTAKELEALHDKLTELDSRVVDLSNDIFQRDQIISEEIENRIDDQLGEVEALYPPVNGRTEVSRAEIEAVVDAKNKDLVNAVDITGKEIEELAMEVASLITKVNGLEARCKELETENQNFREKLTQDCISHSKSQVALALRDKEIEAVAAALQAYISQAPASHTASDFPSAEYIIESLDSQLHGLFREKFSAALADVQREVLDKVREIHTRTLDTVSPNIMLLLKMVNLISARVGKSVRP